MEQLPNDVIVYMALNYDLNTILSFCLTSERMNRVVCQNDNFWRMKFERDFGLQVPTDENPKTYYSRFADFFSGRSVNDAYIHARIIIDLDLIRASLHRGADVNYNGTYTNLESPLIIAAKYGDTELFADLLARGIMSSEKISRAVVGQMLRLFIESEIDKRPFFVELMYDYLFPAIYKFITPRFTKATIDKLEEWNNDPDHDFSDIYNRRIDELRNLYRDKLSTK